MALFALTLLSPDALAAPVSDALMEELDALAVSVEDADAGTADERPVFGEPGMAVAEDAWARSLVVALFAEVALAERAATLLLAQDWAEGLAVQGLSEVPEDDWVRRTQAQFGPVAITEDFWIVPTWCEPPAEARHIMRLDPGLAFGTGTHPTTAMCLRWMALHAPASGWPRVLDYGCGSGILAIAAAQLGASRVDAVDIDPAAVEATSANAAANGVAGCLRIGLAPLAQGEYPLVVANILATPLKVLAPLLAAHVAPGGHLLLAGLLERQADELIAAYTPWLQMSVAASVDGWSLLVGLRPQPHP